VSRAPYDTDSAADFEQGYEAQPAPVFASPSIVPSADFRASAFEDDDELSTGRKKPTWLIAGSVLALVAGLSLVGTHFAQASRAEEERAAEIEQIRQRMAEIDQKHRAEAAASPTEVIQAPSSTVAALLAAGAHSNGVTSPSAERPRGISDARQAAAIRRALSEGAPTRRARGAKAGGRAPKASAAETDDDGSRSNDPIYGL